MILAHKHVIRKRCFLECVGYEKHWRFPCGARTTPVREWHGVGVKSCELFDQTISVQPCISFLNKIYLGPKPYVIWFITKVCTTGCISPLPPRWFCLYTEILIYDKVSILQICNRGHRFGFPSQTCSRNEFIACKILRFTAWRTGCVQYWFCFGCINKSLGFVWCTYQYHS